MYYFFFILGMSHENLHRRFCLHHCLTVEEARRVELLETNVVDRDHYLAKFFFHKRQDNRSINTVMFLSEEQLVQKLLTEHPTLLEDSHMKETLVATTAEASYVVRTKLLQHREQISQGLRVIAVQGELFLLHYVHNRWFDFTRKT